MSQSDKLMSESDKLMSGSNRFEKVFDNLTREVSLDYFEQYIIGSSEHMDQLFQAIRQDRTQNFPRFNIWRLLLEIIPFKGTWQHKKEALEQSRQRWKQLKEQSKTGIKQNSKEQQAAPTPKNPLMRNPLMKPKPEQKKQESDSAVMHQIKVDVERTYQQMAFFQEVEVQKLLESVLFVWSKCNHDISYQQGMHELLASIAYVYFKEAVPMEFQASSEAEIRYLFLNSVEHAQSDIFGVFEKVMEIQKEMFRQNLDSSALGLMNPNSKNNSPILQRILQLQDQKLKFIDLQLFKVLKLQDVKTKTFLLRWIRCLHTREFGLDNSLPIWDSIFLDAYESPNSKNRKQFEFVDAMCLAMFIYLRAVVVTRETANQILQVYQKYPQLEGNYLQQIIRLAWSICEELRTQASNPSSSNWYEDNQKVKKLGLMEKGGYSHIKKQESDKKLQPSHFDVSPQREQIPRESPLKEPDNEVKKETQKSPSPLPKEDDDVLFKPKKQELKGKEEPKGKEESKEKEKEVVRTTKSDSISRTKEFMLTEKQLQHAVQYLKKSIDLNDDIQSRSWANKALKILEDKL